MLGLVAASALLIGFPRPVRAPDTPPFIVACLGTDRIAASVDALTALHGSLSPPTWAADCKAATLANQQRKLLMRKLFSSSISQVPGFEGAKEFIALAEGTTKPSQIELFSRVARDQVIRESISFTGPKYAKRLSEAGKALLDALVAADAVASDNDNRSWLKKVIEHRGWFTISRDGPKADLAAWLLVQHSDADRDFQHEAISLLTPLVGANETSASRFATLYDRWAAGSGQPQRYGLQGHCSGGDNWEPFPIEDRQDLNHRRASVGFPTTEAQYIKEMSAACR